MNEKSVPGHPGDTWSNPHFGSEGADRCLVASQFTPPDGGSRVNPLTTRSRHAVIAVAAWVAAVSAASSFTGHASDLTVVLIAVVAVSAGAIAFFFGEGEARVTFGGWHSLAHLGSASVVTASTIVSIDALIVPMVRLSTVLATGVAATLLIGLVRLLTRHDRWTRARADAPRVIIFGAGAGGEMALRAIGSDPEASYRPIAVLDDDPRRHGRRVEGLKVIGGREKVPELVARGASVLVIAVPSAEGPTVTDLFDLGQSHGLQVRTLPPKRDLFDRTDMSLEEIRELGEADLLGRRRIDTDLASIAGYLTDRVVLVTGAGGSIGSELCRQIATFEPAQLVMLDRDESALHAVQLSIEGQAMLDTECLVLADIRDRRRLERVFAHYRPEVVFHAAALKHLPLLERYPGEGLQTNVQATVNVLDLAARFGVSRFVNVSSDKAANPISVLGYSKRLSERLTAHYSETNSGSYMSVRFGNVLGSRGSVLTAFHQQILSGAPLTITHPDVARYFMTVEEAVELVIQAGAIGSNGDAMVLDMGEPVKIVDIARRLANQAGRDANIRFTALRPGEKIVEDLFGDEEAVTATGHPKITAAAVPSIAPILVDRADPHAEPQHVTDELIRLTFMPKRVASDFGIPDPVTSF